jgi:beta-xylosidase
MTLKEIQIRDPFVFPDTESGIYYLFGSTDKNIWYGPGTGFDFFRSHDLQDWEGPFPAFRPKPDFWATTQFWAPEVHLFNGRHFMFATFNADQRRRGTQILASDHPAGPYEPWTDGPVTPPDWECLDGTLYVDEAGGPWIVFCHEWVQSLNGALYAMRLAPDLKGAAGRPVFLFNAAEAPWVRCLNQQSGHENLELEHPGIRSPVYVTDGPYLHKTEGGALLMLWSSFGTKGYAMGIARSVSGAVEGPWIHEPEPLVDEDGGHGMLFRAFDGHLLLTLHQPNDTPNERAIFRDVTEEGGSIVFGKKIAKNHPG